MAGNVPGRRSRRVPQQRRRPSLVVVNAVLGVVAAYLGVIAGWTQSTQLRVVVGVAFFLVGAAIVVVQVPARAPRPRASAALPSKGNIPFFLGRGKELAELERRHRQGLARASRPHPSGPLLLGIHGRPGVGKTALAQQLALKIERHYRDGLLYLNMGTGGGPKPPRDVLHSLLLDLGWPEQEMRGRTAAELGRVFRAITANKQMLMVLDAARSLQQLSEVLPGGSNCTVITTSRANLLAGRGQHSQRIDPVTGEEAAEILLTALGPDHKAGPDQVAEIIELCDFQPNALLSFADRAVNEGLDRALERLRPGQSRLDVLRYGARDVAERMASEFSNLEPLERRAFLLLTIVESQSFVPWALQPLLEIGSAEAGNLMAGIGRVGLIENQGRDPSGFGRYRFSSLARLFAEQQLRKGDIPAHEVTQARQSFRRAYLAGSVKVMSYVPGATGLLPPLPFSVPGYWYPQVSGWEISVAENLQHWVRAEFGSIVQVVLDAADYGQPALCWQIAARLGDCYSPPVPHARVREAFAAALAAAQASPDPEAAIRVRLATGGYLACVHEYSRAIAEFKAAAALAQEAGNRAAMAEAFRRLGHARQEIGLYDQALVALQDGHAATLHAEGCDARLLEVLLAENRAMREPDRWASPPAVGSLPANPPDSAQFLEKVILGRAARRRREPKACDELLTAARRYSDGNAAHCWDIELEWAATRLHLAARWVRGRKSRPAQDARSYVPLAAQTVSSSKQLGTPHALAQARCVLAHTLILAGQAEASLGQLDLADQALQSMPATDSKRLMVRAQRLRGEALLLGGDPEAALAVLGLARQQLASWEPWAYAEVMMLTGTAHRQLRQFGAALAAHATALEVFGRHHDQAATSYALSEFCQTLRASGGGPFRTRRIRHVLTTT